MSMDNLIRVVNKLQDVFALVGVPSSIIDLPQITVVGSQSSGKSSVLENIVGRDFLPRGSGIVTRRPLVLQLINRPKPEVPVKGPNGQTEPDEWGEFLHIPNKKFYDFNEIRNEIVRDTDAKTGAKLAISPQPINLRVYSPNVLTLTLVDLPGLTKVPVGDQPADIEKQIREMILKFIMKPNAIILAVTAANTDLANSDGLKLARDVDPEGVRTIGVLTKIDLMDKGTDVVDILAGRVIPLRFGYVPVINRSQRDIDTNKAITNALEAEKNFFENHESYKSKAQYCGTPFLTRKLSMILMHHIRSTLPDIKSKITANLVKYRAELAALGDVNAETANQQSGMILGVITEFCTDYRTMIDGNATDLTSQELSGGARISFVFHEVFSNGVRGIDPFDQVKDVDIRTILYNSSGSSPSLFVGTAAFEVLVKQQIRRLEEPSLKCVALVHDELLRILSQLETKQIFKRFPALKDKFHSTVTNFFRKCLSPTNKMVTDIINAEACYINTGHPDFLNGHKAMAVVNERMNANKPQPGGGDKDPKKPGSSAVSPAGPAIPDVPGSDNGFFGSFFQKGQKKKSGVLEPPPAVLKATGSLSEREIMETEVIKLLLASYFNIVKRDVADLVPKAIVLYLVNASKEELQRELLQELYKTDLLDEMLKESEAVVTRRNELKKLIEALVRADEIVGTVAQ